MKLASYSAASLEARAALAVAAKAVDALVQRSLANKAAADAEVDSFVLVGSNRAVDIAAAYGQEDLFA